MAQQATPPQHVLILGSGVFALSTLSTLLARPLYTNTRFTVVSPASSHRNTASWDTTRIIRPDYSDAGYSKLATEAQKLWRQTPWSQDYYESGLLLSADTTNETHTSAAGYMDKGLETTSRVVPKDAIEVFDSRDSIIRAMQAGNAVSNRGNRGYLNRSAGWANSGAAIDRLRARLSKDSRVEFIDDAAQYILSERTASKPRVMGARLRSRGDVFADLTIIAVGAWTPALVDMSGYATCTAQTLLYISLTPTEADALANIPVSIDFTNGHFFFPPTKRTDAHGNDSWEIKIAKHCYGYVNPTSISNPHLLGAAASQNGQYTISLPCAEGTPIPAADANDFLASLAESIPLLDLSRTLKERKVATRVCHYSDTHSGNFIVSPHPDFDPTSVFVMTGDSGHGFKFLPKLGEPIANVIEKTLNLSEGSDGQDETDIWQKKWAWPQKRPDEVIWCEDGSRAGPKGISIASVLRKEQQRTSRL